MNDLSWEAHVNTICAKVAPRLYCLKQLRRAELSRLRYYSVCLKAANHHKSPQITANHHKLLQVSIM